MKLFRRRGVPARPDYMTQAEHLQEAGRLAWVIDDVMQSRAKRSLGDVIALARLHLELAQVARHNEGTRLDAPLPEGETPCHCRK
ncbi:MAG TPA: hypothetical protein VFB06_11260 [Streptosporangiaceae bacterium]|nr:hypothetical protein [Streptosporangiaceae bacterium]